MPCASGLFCALPNLASQRPRETIRRAYASSEAIEGSQTYKDGAGRHHYDQELVGNDATGPTMAHILAAVVGALLIVGALIARYRGRKEN